MEARDRLGVGGELGAQDLERHRLVHQCVRGAIDRAHAALAEPLEQPITAAEHTTDQAVRGRIRRRTIVRRRGGEGRSVPRTEMLLALEVRLAGRADEQSS
jgi:hypothetical protein